MEYGLNRGSSRLGNEDGDLEAMKELCAICFEVSVVDTKRFNTNL